MYIMLLFCVLFDPAFGSFTFHTYITKLTKIKFKKVSKA